MSLKLDLISIKVTNAITGKTQCYMATDLGDPSRPIDTVRAVSWSVFKQYLEEDLGLDSGKDCFAEIHGGLKITHDRHLRGVINHACVHNKPLIYFTIKEGSYRVTEFFQLFTC